MQWKLPATFSNFIQRAGRAARGRGRTGLAVLLVEKSAYNMDIVSQPAPSTGDKEGTKKLKKAKKDMNAHADLSETTVTKPDTKETRQYARMHGAHRGGSNKDDDPPDGTPPLLNPESSDEGLLTFVQSTTCRRRIWALAFESPTISSGILHRPLPAELA